MYFALLTWNQLPIDIKGEQNLVTLNINAKHISIKNILIIAILTKCAVSIIMYISSALQILIKYKV